MAYSVTEIVSEEKFKEARERRDIPPYIEEEIMHNIDKHWTFSTEVKWQTDVPEYIKAVITHNLDNHWTCSAEVEWRS